MSMEKIQKLLALSALIIIAFALSGNVSAAPSTTYRGAEFCGLCHAQKLSDWKTTSHSNNTGIIPATETYWVHTKNNTMTKQDFVDKCASCHVVGWDEATHTWASSADPSQFLNIQCENCHGAYQPHSRDNPMMTLDYTTQVCATCHAQPKDHALSKHSESWTDLAASGQQKDSCLHCMTTQGFIGKDVTTSTEGLASLSCASCHNVHLKQYPTLLRAASPLELCGECHVGNDQPQSEVYPGGAHATAGLGCTDCHGQGTRLRYGKQQPWLNHTFSIFYTYYPYNQTESMVCSKCHDLDWATNQLGRIQSLTVSIVTDVSGRVALTEATIAKAKAAGVSQTELDKATALVNHTLSLVDYVEKDRSKGFHNSESVFQILNDASRYNSEAEATVLSAQMTSLTDLKNAGTQLEATVTSLEAQVNNLTNSYTDLQNKVQDLNNTGNTNLVLGGVGGLVIGAVIIYLLIRRK